MGLFDSLVGGGQKNQNGSRIPRDNSDYVIQLSSLMSNPYRFAKEHNLNIPSNIKRPEQMVKYVINSGQIDNGLIRAIQTVASQGR